MCLSSISQGTRERFTTVLTKLAEKTFYAAFARVNIFADSRCKDIENIVALADLAGFNTQHPWKVRLK